MPCLAPVLLAVLLVPQARVERVLGAMGTQLRVEVEAVDRPAGLRASEAAVRAIEAVEARLSTWRADSELAALNRAPVGEPWPLSPWLARVLADVRELREATGGAFEPALGPLIEAWDLRGGGRRPSAAELERARAACGLERLELRDGAALRLHAELRLEEGGFGKGVGLDDAHAALRAAGVRRARIDLGGQLLLHDGDPQATHAVRLADPRDRLRPVLELRSASGSVATSGSSERGFVLDGERLSHVLDPATGRPCPDFGSVSVWCPTGLGADALSTALFVLGPEAGLRWTREHEDVEAVFLVVARDGLRVRASDGLRGRLQPLVDGLALEGE